jgi:hypothetical protein
MKSNTEIVHGGGWVKRQFVGKPKALIFTFLAVIWLGVSRNAAEPGVYGLRPRPCRSPAKWH